MSRITWILFVLALAGGLVTAFTPRTDADHPAKCNYIHFTDLDAHTTRVLADAPAGLPAPIAAATEWNDPQPLLPWSSREVPSLPFLPTHEAGPTIIRKTTTPQGDRTRLELEFQTRPGAVAAMLLIPDGTVATLNVHGRLLDPGELRRGPRSTRIVTIYGPPPEGLVITAELTAQPPWKLLELLPGLPPGTPAPERPADVVPYQNGDLTIALRSL